MGILFSSNEKIQPITTPIIPSLEEKRQIAQKRLEYLERNSKRYLPQTTTTTITKENTYSFKNDDDKHQQYINDLLN